MLGRIWITDSQDNPKVGPAVAGAQRGWWEASPRRKPSKTVLEECKTPRVRPGQAAWPFWMESSRFRIASRKLAAALRSQPRPAWPSPRALTFAGWALCHFAVPQRPAVAALGASAKQGLCEGVHRRHLQAFGPAICNHIYRISCKGMWQQAIVERSRGCHPLLFHEFQGMHAFHCEHRTPNYIW